MAAELVHLSVARGIATITLDSPHNRNALSSGLQSELRTALTATADDEAVRVVVLAHTGPVFCSGMDLKEPQSDQPGVSTFPGILEQVWSHPKPVVARIAGPARAGGIGLVAAADLAIAAHEATFAFSEVRVGVVPAVISVTVLPRLARRAAHELMLTGETFDARRAAEIGLINRAVPAAELDTELDRYVDMLAKGAPEALTITKQLLHRAPAPTMNEDFEAMSRLSAERFASAEGQEGMHAFAEKRTPSWVSD